MARKPRNYRAEWEAAQEKARDLRARHAVELGRIVQATGADALDPEVLAGILVSGVVGAREEKAREAWRDDGVRFFRKRERKRTTGASSGAGDPPGGDPQGGSRGGEG